MCLGRSRKILLIALWRPNQRDKTGFKRDGPIAGIRLESKSWRTFMVLIPCICQALSLLRPSANRASLTFILLKCHLLQEGFPSHQAPPSQHMLHLLHVLGHNGNYWISFSVYLNISLSLFSLWLVPLPKAPWSRDFLSTEPSTMSGTEQVLNLILVKWD